MNPIQIDLTSNILTKKKVNVVTLGCSKNTVDTETLQGMLKYNNIELTDQAEGSDILIINTCGFIDVAKEESINAILEAGELKKLGKIKEIYVAGCLSERYTEDMKLELPEVDNFFGVTDFKGIIESINPLQPSNLTGMRYVPEGTYSSYLKISEGCDNPCSFCAIPIMRGGHSSRSYEDILIEANHLAQQGVKEIILVAQDSTYYGLDLYGERKLANLLDKVAQVRGIEWVRLMYAYPAKFPLDILPIIAHHDTICKYIDMPIQHITDKVLKSMRRGITKRATLDLINKIRETIPNISLRTTLIIGYPNEGENEFQELMEFVEEVKFDRLGVFAYSKEDNTTAFDLEDPIPEELKQERMERIMQLQQRISSDKNDKLIGTYERVFVEAETEGEYTARSYRDAPEVDGQVYIKTDKVIKVGDFVDVKIVDATDYDIFAEM